MRERAARGLLVTHLLSVVGEWAVVVGVLVHAFTWGGARAVGVVSLVLLVPPLVSAPLIGSAQARWRTHTIRVASLAAQVVCFGAAAMAAASGVATPLVAAFVVMGLSAVMVIPPTTAALLPQIERSTSELVRANLWVTYGDSASSLLGPLAAGLVLGFGGPPAVFVAATLGAAIGLATTVWRAAPHVKAARSGALAAPKRVLRRTLAEFRSHPWGRGVLFLASARNLTIGSFDVLLVIVALDVLDMGDGGPGYLGALVGAGALASTLVTAAVVRRARLRVALLLAVASAAVLAVALGVRIERPTVLFALPLIGLAIATIDALSRALLLRSTDPRNLASVYASLGLVAGAAQIAGSALAQLMLFFGNASIAFIAVGGVLLGLAALSLRSLRRADENAEIPVVEMAVLSGLPMLSALSSAALERVARSTRAVRVDSGDAIMTEGEPVDGCYVIAEGSFDVVSRGRRLGRLARGDVVGEVALLTRITPNTTVVAMSEGAVLRIERRSFLAALTGHDLPESVGPLDLADARGTFREVVAAHDRFTSSASADSTHLWLGLGATGRLLGEPTFTEALARTGELAEATSNQVALAEAAALATWPGAFFFVADNPDGKMIGLCEKALIGLSGDDAMRVRVLATLASNLAFVPDSTRRRKDLIAEAHQLAAAHDDPALVAAVMNSEFISMWEPGTLQRREVIGARLTEIGQQIEDHELQYVGRFFEALCATERGSLDRARHELIELRALAPMMDDQYFEFLSERLLLSIDIARGQSEVTDRIDALAERHAATYADTDGTWALQVGGLAYEAGKLGTMVPAISAMLEGPHARTWRAALALAHVAAGQPQAAAAVIAKMEKVPRSYFWMTATQTEAEVAANLGMTDRCAELFAELLPYRGQVGVTASGSRLFGLVSRSLGQLALALGWHDRAVDLLEEAVTDAESVQLPFESVMSRRLLAQALIARGDGRLAQQRIAEAMPMARERGYAGEAEHLQRIAEPAAPRRQP